MRINFLFMRHANSCQNLVGNVINDNKARNELMKEYRDPTLSDMGKQDSIKTGIKLKENISKFDIVGTSTMIRTIETAYFTNSGMGNPFKEIYVFPYLREILSETINIDDPEENIKANEEILKNEVHSIKRLDAQEDYFKIQGIDEYINYIYIRDNILRNQPGNIDTFINWFCKNVIYNYINKRPFLNILIITHAHVIRQFSNEEIQPNNNMGFILRVNCERKNDDVEIIYDKNDIIEVDLDINRTELKCPMERCSNVCNYIN